MLQWIKMVYIYRNKKQWLLGVCLAAVWARAEHSWPTLQHRIIPVSGWLSDVTSQSSRHLTWLVSLLTQLQQQWCHWQQGMQASPCLVCLCVCGDDRTFSWDQNESYPSQDRQNRIFLDYVYIVNMLFIVFFLAGEKAGMCIFSCQHSPHKTNQNWAMAVSSHRRGRTRWAPEQTALIIFLMSTDTTLNKWAN